MINIPHTALKFIVASTGRCGSVYFARFLTSVGIPCNHECVFKREGFARDRIKRPITSVVSRREGLQDSPNPMAESSLFSVPFLNLPLFNKTKLIHLVRHPLKVVTSFSLDLKTFSNEWNTLNPNHMFKHYLSLDNCRNAIECACKYYVEWNKKIEIACKSHKFHFHRIEDEISDSLFEFLEIPSKSNYYNDKLCNSFSKRHHKAPLISLNDIPEGSLKDELIKMGLQYGYEFN